jgi:GDPmannose 4,6-dehydratase
MGDASKAKAKLGWQPRVTFGELVRMMVETDLVLAKRERALVDHDAREAREAKEGA